MMTRDNSQQYNLLINGEFSNSDLKELKNIIPDNFTIEKYITKSIEKQKIIKIILRFTVSVISSGIAWEIIKLGFIRTYDWIKNKKPDVEIQTGITILIQGKKKHISINLGVPIKEFDLFIKDYNKQITSKLIKQNKNGTIISGKWDKKKKKIDLLIY